jgi:hypothetical protein
MSRRRLLQLFVIQYRPQEAKIMNEPATDLRIMAALLQQDYHHLLLEYPVCRCIYIAFKRKKYHYRTPKLVLVTFSGLIHVMC